MDASIYDVFVVNVQKTVEECIALACTPSMNSLYTLKSNIENATSSWLLDFLENGGLTCLLDSLCAMTIQGPSNFSDAILQFDCLNCITTVLSTDVGMMHILELPNGLKKLTSALNTNHSMTKKELFEILSVLCMFSPQSYYAVLEALNYYKKETDQAHRFSILVTEITQTETVAYKCTILTAINCIINGNLSLQGRNKIRNEFISLGLLDTLSVLHAEEFDKDFQIQIEAFYSQKHKDEEDMQTKFEMDYQSPSALLDSIIEKTLGTPKYVSFLHILQDLLSLEYNSENEENSEKWQLIENLIPKIQSGEKPVWTDGQKCKKVYDKDLDILKEDNFINSLCEGSSDSQEGNAAPVIKYPFGTEKNLFDTNCDKLLLWMCFTPSKKLKKIHWSKITPKEIEKSDNCIWRSSNDFLPIIPNFSKMEDLFYSNIPVENTHLVGMQTLMNVTLFLTRSEYDAEDLVRALQENNVASIPQTTLSSLIKILPTKEEVAALRSYQGERLLLHPTEQFLVELSDVNDFHLILRGHFLQSEFLIKFVKLRTSIRSMVDACKTVLEDAGLRDFLHLILGAGNYLNQESCYGCAYGFKLSSLLEVSKIKATEFSYFNLLHHLVELAEENDEQVLMFTADADILEKAAACCLDETRNEVTALSNSLKQFLKELSQADQEVNNLFSIFIKDVKLLFGELQTRLRLLRTLAHKVAGYFCENVDDFSLQKCFQDLHEFYEAVKKCRTVSNGSNFLIGCPSYHRLFYGRDWMQFIVPPALENACSSALENKKGPMDRILQEVHGGNFEKFAGKPNNLISTPARSDASKHHLNFSRISFAGSQIKLPEDEDDFDETLTDFRITQKNKISSAKTMLFKIHTAPFTKVSQATCSESSSKPFKKTHVRSQSDFTDSIVSGENQWHKYKEICEIKNGEILKAPLARPESLFTLESLNLETPSNTLTKKEVSTVPEMPVLFQLSPDNKPKKSDRRSSFGNFISRLSKAVLKPRNTNQARVSKAPPKLSIEKSKDQTEKICPQLKIQDKENSLKPNNTNQRNFGQKAPKLSLGKDKNIKTVPPKKNETKKNSARTAKSPALSSNLTNKPLCVRGGQQVKSRK
ncbi:inverted formin-2 [Octopus bimaculoides]|nr:inverted formin-2 [Octopus bimaculoides]